MTTRPRARNAAHTRSDILTAARRLFAASSFEHVGMRDIAEEAGINVALVSRYFGSKEELFRKVLLERPNATWFGESDSPADIAAWLTTLAVADEIPSQQDDLERLRIILNSATSPTTAALISRAFVEEVFAPLAARLGPDHPQVRAGLALILVIGATVMNGLLGVDITGAEARAEGRRRLHALIVQALAG